MRVACVASSTRSFFSFTSISRPADADYRDAAGELAIFGTEHSAADLSWHDVGEYTRQSYRIMARAAILAMLAVLRETNEAQMEVAIKMLRYWNRGDG